MTTKERIEYMNKMQNEYPKVDGVEYGDRWSLGMDHHPKSKELYKKIEKIDFVWFDDHFCWKSGGDGDTGETLMYALDIIFDEKDKRVNHD